MQRYSQSDLCVRSLWPVGLFEKRLTRWKQKFLFLFAWLVISRNGYRSALTVATAN